MDVKNYLHTVRRSYKRVQIVLWANLTNGIKAFNHVCNKI